MIGIFRNRWWVVFASACGLLAGTGAVNIFGFAVFLKPVTEDLGLSRGDFAFGLVLTSLATAAGCPFLGYLVDRWGARLVMIPGIALFALCVAAYSRLTASTVTLFTLFLLAGWFGSVQSPVAYAAVISQWFDRMRGLALGIAMAGVGLGVALIPKITSRLVTDFGWRAAYVGLGITIIVLALVPVAIFLREPPSLDAGRSAAARARRAVTADALPGLSFRAAFLGSWRFWALTLAFFLAVGAINGTLTNIIALLTDRGIAVAVATTALSAAGLAIIVGRILSGWCLDRFFGPYVAIVFFLVPMAGIGLLASGAGGSVPLLGAILCGMGIGAEVDLMAFFVSRYFGLKAYGKIYGTMFGFFSVGTGIGPWIAAKSFDLYHSYGPAFIAFEIGLLVTCLLFLRLGPYPYPPQKAAES